MQVHSDRLTEFKIQASHLLKALRSEDSTTAEAAAKRFQRLAPFREHTAQQIVQERDQIQRKHALDVIARENGRVSWKKLKDASDTVWNSTGGAYLNHWFRSYEEAKSFHEMHGGYLLPNQGKWFVCETSYIETIGLDPSDPRWKAMGYDAAKPRDKKACQELIAMLRNRGTQREL